MTDRHGIQRDFNFSALGRAQFNLFYDEGGTKFMADSGFYQGQGQGPLMVFCFQGRAIPIPRASAFRDLEKKDTD